MFPRNTVSMFYGSQNKDNSLEKEHRILGLLFARVAFYIILISFAFWKTWHPAPFLVSSLFTFTTYERGFSNKAGLSVESASTWNHCWVKLLNLTGELKSRVGLQGDKNNVYVGLSLFN